MPLSLVIDLAFSLMELPLEVFLAPGPGNAKRSGEMRGLINAVGPISHA